MPSRLNFLIHYEGLVKHSFMLEQMKWGETLKKKKKKREKEEIKNCSHEEIRFFLMSLKVHDDGVRALYRIYLAVIKFC